MYDMAKDESRGMNKNLAISLRVNSKEMELIKRTARYRFIRDTNNMKDDSVSEYLRSLLHRDLEEAMTSIRSRRSL